MFAKHEFLQSNIEKKTKLLLLLLLFTLKESIAFP